jgi:hypothetical protein
MTQYDQAYNMLYTLIQNSNIDLAIWHAVLSNAIAPVNCDDIPYQDFKRALNKLRKPNDEAKTKTEKL